MLYELFSELLFTVLTSKSIICLLSPCYPVCIVDVFHMDLQYIAYL